MTLSLTMVALWSTQYELVGLQYRTGGLVYQWLGVNITLLYSLTPSSAIKVKLRKASLLFSMRFIPEEMSTMPKLKSTCFVRGQRMEP